MANTMKVVEPELLVEPLLGLLEEVDSVPLVISGSSMTPFLVHRRDTVYLSKADRPLKKGDMILYRRDSGAYILHRILRIEEGGYTLVGDAQTWLEPGIREDQVLALVTAVRRKGKLLRPGSFWWEFFEKVWLRMIPLRPVLMRLYGCLLWGKKTHKDKE